MTPLSVVYNKAADLIETEGWRQGGGGWAGIGGWCLEGALWRAMGGRVMGCGCGCGMQVVTQQPRDDFYGSKAYTFLSQMAGVGVRLYMWNDSLGPRTGKAEVVWLLRRAAQLAEQQDTMAEVRQMSARIARTATTTTYTLPPAPKEWAKVFLADLKDADDSRRSKSKKVLQTV